MFASMSTEFILSVGMAVQAVCALLIYKMILK